MTTVLYALPAAVFAAAWATTCWRYLTVRRALIQERAAARLRQGAAARDIAALERCLQRAVAGQAAEDAVLAAAARVVDRAVLLHQTHTEHQQHPKGGGDA